MIIVLTTALMLLCLVAHIFRGGAHEACMIVAVTLMTDVCQIDPALVFALFTRFGRW
jgi:hypothetical protein